MPATLPPWLNVQPTDFLQASEAGAGAGLNLAKTKIQSQQFQQEMGFRVQSHMQDMAMKQQQFQQDEQDRQARVNQAQEQHQLSAANLQMETQRAQVEKQTSQMKMMVEATDAARKFQAQQKYQAIFGQLTQSGVDPSTASMQAILAAGPSDLGESGASTASILKQSQPFVPQVQDFGDGVRGFKTGPQSWAQVPEKTGQIWKDQTKTINGEDVPGQASFDANGNQIGPWYPNDRGAAFEKAGASGDKQSVSAYERAIQKYQDAKSKDPTGRMFDRDGSMLRNTRRIAQALDGIDPGNPFAADFLGGADAAPAAPSGATKIGRFSMQVVGP